jgi:hypothetical protein
MSEFPFEFVKNAKSESEVIAICAEALFYSLEDLKDKIENLIYIVDNKSL